MPPKQPLSINFKPDFKYSLFYWTLALMMLIVMCIIFSKLDIFSIRALPIIVPPLLFLSATVICIPLLRASFSITISDDGIHGPRDFVPFYSSSLYTRWPLIHGLEFECFLWTFVFYRVKNARGDVLFFLPAGFENHIHFKKYLKQLAPAHSPILLMLKFNQTQIADLTSRVITGMVTLKSHTHSAPTVPCIKIQLMIDDLCICTVSTTDKGKFYIETKIPLGDYTLKVAEKGFKGSLPFNVSRAYHGDLLVELKHSLYIDG